MSIKKQSLDLQFEQSKILERFNEMHTNSFKIKTNQLFCQKNSLTPEREQDCILSVGDQKKQEKVQISNRIIIRQKRQSVYHFAKQEQHQFSNHVINLFNIIAINEAALMKDSHWQSLIVSNFYIKEVFKIQHRYQAIILKKINCKCSHQFIFEFISRLKNNGDLKLYDLSIRIERFIQIYKEELSLRQHPEVGNEMYANITQFLKRMHGKAYFCVARSNILIFSESFLSLVDQDYEDFILKTLKYRSITQEYFSTQRYKEVMTQYFQNLELLFKHKRGELSHEELINYSKYTFIDCLTTNLQRKILCDIEFKFVADIACFEVVKQIKQIQAKQTIQHQPALYQKIKREMERFSRRQSKVLRNIFYLPNSFTYNKEHNRSQITLKNDIQ